MDSEQDEDEFYLSCSDEEDYNETGDSKGKMKEWRPKKTEDAIRMAEAAINNPGGVINLRWQCPGRRPRTPNQDEEYETDEDEAAAKFTSSGQMSAAQSEAAAKSAAANAAMDFDFDDEVTAKPGAAMGMTPTRRPLHPGQQRELKGSARKKTSSFNNIVSNLKRHRQIDAANKAKMAAMTGMPTTPGTNSAPPPPPAK